MSNSPTRLHKIAIAAVIAALYAALTMMLAPISYGAVQCRISEALCILPYFLPWSTWGLFAGCFLANLMTGNLMDIIFGSLATLLAALCTAAIGRRSHTMVNSIVACAMPVLFNAFIVGAVITGAYEGLNILTHMSVFLLNALWVGLGEAVCMYAIGLPLMRNLPKAAFLKDRLAA